MEDHIINNQEQVICIMSIIITMRTWKHKKELRFGTKGPNYEQVLDPLVLLTTFVLASLRNYPVLVLLVILPVILPATFVPASPKNATNGALEDRSKRSAIPIEKIREAVAAAIAAYAAGALPTYNMNANVRKLHKMKSFADTPDTTDAKKPHGMKSFADVLNKDAFQKITPLDEGGVPWKSCGPGYTHVGDDPVVEQLVERVTKFEEEHAKCKETLLQEHHAQLGAKHPRRTQRDCPKPNRGLGNQWIEKE
ncbi:hypothetical protein F4819DRAFT_482486 [Hypoxylon fuscum]|nr:hypothetical protein F4819DRAFT_482486 [Hypoxylon fuscum]